VTRHKTGRAHLAVNASATERCAALAGMVEAVAGDAGVAAAVSRAVTAGALVPDEAGHALIPGVPGDHTGALPEWSDWLGRGFVPFRVKMVAYPAPRIRALRCVFRVLSSMPELRCVPHWAVAGAVLSLYLPAAADLRPAGPDPVADFDVAHRACLRWLGLFVEREPLLRLALARDGLGKPTVFPVAERYGWALAGLTALIGETGLPPTVPVSGPAPLFADPKLANFLVPAHERSRVGRSQAVSPVRTDLDFLCFQCPLSLQIVLVFFSHPIAIGAEPVLPAFLRLRRLAQTAASQFGLPHTEIDAMILYHLLRNAVSALAQSRGGSKAREMTAMLAAAVQALPGLAVRRRAVHALRGLAGDGAGEGT
jgi:hypothetical protein